MRDAASVARAELRRSAARGPGVNVIQMSARDINITSRQATATLANSQLVLLDGRSVYLDFFGIVLWDFLPTNLGDIKQIEVIRGPASAVWGANALTGVVNIITKTPREAPGTTVVAQRRLVRAATPDRGVGRAPAGSFGANASVAACAERPLVVSAVGRLFRLRLRSRGRPDRFRVDHRSARSERRRSAARFYPADGTGPIGTAFTNSGTSQPKFDARVDQEIGNGGRITYAGGVAGTQRHHPHRDRPVRHPEGIVHRRTARWTTRAVR